MKPANMPPALEAIRARLTWSERKLCDRIVADGAPGRFISRVTSDYQYIVRAALIEDWQVDRIERATAGIDWFARLQEALAEVVRLHA